VKLNIDVVRLLLEERQGGRTSVTFSLPRQAVSLVKMTW
jgi:hypothetical protein